jgi:hypothetical protein
MKIRVCFVIVSLVSAMVGTAAAQTAAGKPIPTSTLVPRLIRFSGVAKDDSGKPVTGVVGITFSLYKDQQGGAPLWMETQNVQADAAGRYSALLGSASANGVPLELFSSAEAQWLGVQIQGQPERPRVVLVSVPYALKAHEAETLSGRNISDFVLANDAKTQSNATNNSQTNSNGVGSSSPPPPSGPTTFTGSNSTQIVGVTQKGSGTGLSATAVTHAAVAGTITGASNTALYGLASNTSAGSTAAGVTGQANTQLGPGVQGVTGSSKGIGVQGVVTASSGGTAVQGLNKATSGFSTGVSGQTSSVTTNSSGLSGFEAATTGQVYGVVGGTNSTTTSAAGVDGYESATTGKVFGVIGSTNSTTNYAAGVSGYEGAATGQVSGVSGGTSSTTTGASGVNGNANATAGNVYGVSGYSASTAGVGTLGTAYASSGNTTGVLGSTVSPNGIGAFGLSTSTSGGTGVQGQTESTSGGAAGIFVAHGGSGLILSGLTGSTFKGVFSVDAAGNGFYAGNLNVTGKLTKGSGSFKIDHPLDPANKYLSHSFVESPDMMNVYNGNITTDGHRLATVTLPDYFEALNQDFRYQLTVIGKFAQAIVDKKIAANRFVIRTSKPNVEVSWQVTGIRQDAYAKAYRIPVEEEKPPQEQGHYLHPELFGAAPEREVGYQAPPVPTQDERVHVSSLTTPLAPPQ